MKWIAASIERGPQDCSLSAKQGPPAWHKPIRPEELIHRAIVDCIAGYLPDHGLDSVACYGALV